ncbi:MAG: hypothetical protein CVV52_04035 [Spirochaetae bacterium HGW-Spirochaetae-8]|jgi:hypothetical protein|nr:MAG: hypothetical protein CVV52_04035 [Spirochaetae bacterium HGW-Spirochaetae-8]
MNKEESSDNLSAYKQRKIIQAQSKKLRNIFLDAINEWESNIENDLQKENISLASTKKIKEAVLREVNEKLIWKTLEKNERYNTPYYHDLLEKLRIEHPNLEVVNRIHTFVQFPVFNLDDIESAFSCNCESLVFDN